jgi:hypothetical protein
MAVANVGEIVADSLLMRATYFTAGFSQPPEGPPGPTVADVVGVFRQLEAYIYWARTLGEDTSTDPTRTAYRVLRIEMRSPLLTELHLPLSAVQSVGVLGAFVLLAERISTFGPRTNAKRAKAYLETTQYEAEERAIRRAEQDILSKGNTLVPTHIDFIDPEEDTNAELEEIALDE